MILGGLFKVLDKEFSGLLYDSVYDYKIEMKIYEEVEKEINCKIQAIKIDNETRTIYLNEKDNKEKNNYDI